MTSRSLAVVIGVEGTMPMINRYMAEKADETASRTKILINEDWCKGCGICIEFCPKGILVSGNSEGKPVVTDSSLCSRCMLCEVRCPDFAIRIRSEGDDDESS